MEFIVGASGWHDPFQAELVLVAEYRHGAGCSMEPCPARFGIAANIEFPLRRALFWIFRARPEGYSGRSAFSKQSMSWKLMTLLPQT
ncbi:exodeoxyribonuclease V subunit gamma [Klebsiella pneumoniae]|nr:exodeoxyribonuclease V subunit gamma [Klebsiella pneumoniae]